MRKARIKGEGGDCYHCMNRMLDGPFVMGDEEKAFLRETLRSCEGFCGVRVLTYALMRDHFHVLVEVPPRRGVSDGDLLRRLETLYSKGFAAEIGGRLQSLEEQNTAASRREAEEIRARFAGRMGDVSQFMKTMKQRFTQWFNREHRRRGTLWEQRFKSVLVERGPALAVMAAYIDLNAVRAGVVRDPGDYPFCGYGEARAGSGRARQGLAVAIAGAGSPATWSATHRRYRSLLDAGGKGKRPHSDTAREAVRVAVESGGKLSLAQALHCRVRHFSDGVALGSRDFVESVFEKNRGFFGSRRKTGARRIRRLDDAELFTARDLRRDPLTAPK